MKKNLFKLTLIATLTSSMAHAATIDLRILETTDLHGNMVDYDYYKDSDTEKYGLTRTATLIHQARAEVKNSVLVDNGDIIQGSPMADYVATRGLKKGETHPVYKALNTLQYTVGSLGNHEFNYGLDYLHKAIAGARFPYINANVFDAKTGKNYFKPYLIVDTPVVDQQGKSHTVRIGYMGFVPPQIMQWDKKNLEGKVTVKDITETAQALVPQLRKEGADIIIAIAHSGVSADPYKALAENSSYYLSEVEGIHAVMFGHSHGVFPGSDFRALPNADIEKGTLNGVPAVMPGQWGSHLGVVDLQLEGETGAWKVISGTAQARPIFDTTEKKALVTRDETLAGLMQEDHEKTRAFANQPIGKTQQAIYSYLALVQDDPSIQVVNDAQKAYVEHHIQGDPDLAGLPVLAATAPFKAGGRKNDPHGYIEVKQGDMSFRNAADLYVYSNTLSAVKITGAELQQWLECSAGLFNQIDIHNRQPQSLINWDARTYILDTMDGVNYQIDVTQPARYDKNCELVNKDANRIKNLSYQGKPVDPTAYFLVATDNYRTDTGKFAGTGVERVVLASPDEVRTVVAEYVKSETQKQGALAPKADKNWSIAPILNAPQPLDIRVETSPSEAAADYIQQHADYPMQKVGTDEVGFAVYKIDLQRKPTQQAQ